MAIEVKPTRSELTKLKKKIKLAKSGHALLKKKRDGLILDFFEIMRNAKTINQELYQNFKSALNKINIARTLETDLRIKSMAMAIKETPQIDLKTKNIMGVIVPKIQSKSVQKHILERGLGVVTSSCVIDEATFAYEKVVENIIAIAEVETSIKILLQEIEKTKRRVNALEFAVIPQMEILERFIKLRLEEMEREGIFRLKRIKE